MDQNNCPLERLEVYCKQYQKKTNSVVTSRSKKDYQNSQRIKRGEQLEYFSIILIQFCFKNCFYFLVIVSHLHQRDTKTKQSPKTTRSQKFKTNNNKRKPAWWQHLDIKENQDFREKRERKRLDRYSTFFSSYLVLLFELFLGLVPITGKIDRIL